MLVMAIYNIGNNHYNGVYGLSQDYTKALELWLKAAKLGYAPANFRIGTAYKFGEEGVEMDEKKAVHYFELAAMSGSVWARYNLGVDEHRRGNVDRALKHHMIAVVGGHTNSLEEIKRFYLNGYATKEDYTKGLRAYQLYLDEIKSEQRDSAAKFKSSWKYY